MYDVMMTIRIHIGWIWCSILLALLTSCSSSDGEGQQGPAMLTIYVYSPDKPIITRSDVGSVNASEAENTVNSL